jgi:hypothetical protein
MVKLEELRAGEIVLLPRNDIHTLASAAGVAPVSAADLIQQSPEGGVLKVRYGGRPTPLPRRLPSPAAHSWIA